ncbi:hypothetical protein SDRG_15046 [Saprolegnia diclina VS20]|uniref:ABC transporter domain-containing protein n=1 Tax=Saprolegnia diclina (strain VS20) TaxID=1156394 RepID=T0Q199_SAPDV|nr:hypothetical protein SDRG_15046 [Saprolegnia diclina VS20]EQC27145.1 hypothetical protein SDRG_15046 [Saprolegnia diclina VS20]|eukprot:XP_008619431.1 hypothetical protein SDRG_15046 [Saprolegnia diclina VS20]
MISPTTVTEFLPMLDDTAPSTEAKTNDNQVVAVTDKNDVIAINKGYHAPVQPATLGWHDLRYTVQAKSLLGKKGPTKTILKGISGHVAPGQLTAIMGPSGSGKTTLLDILADRIATGVVEGDLEVNGRPRHSASFRKMATYVAQEDSLLGSFTVLETLRFAARISLKAPADVLEERVQNAIADMGLTSCANTRVGDIFFKGISGGQKRRLSIAIALLTNPSILLLDEPTSGLDAASTYYIMKYIAKLCDAGRTVVCTIHQPSTDVYNLFSTLSILVEGRTVFFGPPASALTHFASLHYPCPNYSNPAEYFVGLVNTDFEGHADVNAFVDAFARSDLGASVVRAFQADRTLSRKSDVLNHEASAFTQWQVLLQRNLLNNARNPGLFWVRLFMYIMLAFMVGTMYYHTNAALTKEDLLPLLFYVQAFLVFMSVAVLPFFIEQRASLMCVIAAAVPHYIIGIALGAGLFGMFMLCEGFMVPRHAIPDYWIWAYYLAFHTYSFESFVYTHFNPIQATDATAKAILVRYGFQDVDVDRNMVILVGYTVVFQLLFGWILYRFHTGRR